MLRWRGSNLQLDTAAMLHLLSKSEKWYLLFFAILQFVLGIMDLIGILLMGLLGKILLDGSTQSSITFLGKTLTGSNGSTTILVLMIFSMSLLIIRTVFSIILTRKILFFFSSKAAEVSSDLISGLLGLPLMKIQKRSTQDLLYSVTSGVETLVVRVMGTAVTLFSDFMLLMLLLGGLLWVDMITTSVLLVVFIVIGFTLFPWLNSRGHNLGNQNYILNVESNSNIIEVLNSYRELYVNNRRFNFIERISATRKKISNVMAEMNFLPYIGKYLIETLMVLCAILIGILNFVLHDLNQALTILLVFLAAGTRIAPAILRVQQGLLQIKSGFGIARSTLHLVSENEIQDEITILTKFTTSHPGFTPDVMLKNVSFSYSPNTQSVLSNVNLRLEKLGIVAVVGQSGVGKSTLIDLILGILPPDLGEVRISGLSPIDSFKRWPGAVAYVPQKISLQRGSIRENMIMGFNKNEVPDSLLWECLGKAALEDFVRGLENELDYDIGEDGNKLSGGQRQRLGLARSLVTKPKLLVLDEATSSLDSESEDKIANSLKKLANEMLVITIAHKTQTINAAEVVIEVSKTGLLISNIEDSKKGHEEINNYEKK